MVTKEAQSMECRQAMVWPILFLALSGEEDSQGVRIQSTLSQNPAAFSQQFQFPFFQEIIS